MSFVADRVSQTAANPGSGAVTPSGSVAGFQTFASGVTTGEVVTIAIESTIPGDFEVCDSVWNGTTLSRGEISGSSTGSRVTFTTTVNVFLTPSARALKGTRSGTVILRSLGNFGVI